MSFGWSFLDVLAPLRMALFAEIPEPKIATSKIIFLTNNISAKLISRYIIVI